MSKSPVIEKRLESQPSWVVATDNVELAVTKLGAHMAPVIFCRNEGGLQPYHISPWQNEKLAGMAPVETPLRGDFFCLPFGANQEPFHGEKHPAHGETAGGVWSLEGGSRDGNSTTLRIHMTTKARPGSVRRAFTLVDGENAVYCRTIVHGFAGRSPFAHHATLRTTGEDHTLLVSTSKFAIGRTYPIQLSDPAGGSYQFLDQDASFTSLAKVPSIFRNQPPADYTAFPTNPGFCDLLQQFEKAVPGKKIPSWVAAVNTTENWLWFALKDPAQMPGRLFWVENRGRHNSPWNGRNRCLGMEDGCMYFDRGVAGSSRPNPISRAGIPTAHLFTAKKDFDIRYIQGALRVPRNFGRVRDVTFSPGAATFHSASGKKVTTPVNHAFLFQ